jgi:hypothetical protein
MAFPGAQEYANNGRRNGVVRSICLQKVELSKSLVGQNRKYSPRAYVFRFAPESGHAICAFMSTRPSFLLRMFRPVNL